MPPAPSRTRATSAQRRDYFRNTELNTPPELRKTRAKSANRFDSNEMVDSSADRYKFGPFELPGTKQGTLDDEIRLKILH